MHLLSQSIFVMKTRALVVTIGVAVGFHPAVWSQRGNYKGFGFGAGVFAQTGTTTASFGAVRVETSTPRTVNVSLSVEF